MNLEQIVKETIAKMVDEKHLTAAELKKREEIVKAMKDTFKGPAPAMYAIATKKAEKLAEEGDHEVSMAQRSLDSIIRNAMELKAKIGDQEIDIPAWIQDHITNSENYIDQASEGYYAYENGSEGGEQEEMDEARFKKGEDVGEKGKNFVKIATSAAKQYGSKEAGAKVAGAILKKVVKEDEMDEANLGHNESSSIEQEGRFWIVTYQTANGTKEKSFESETEARKFYNTLDESQELDEISIPSNVESLANKIISWYEKHPNPKMQSDRLPSVEKNIEYLMSKTVGKNAWDFKQFEKVVKEKYPLVFNESQELDEFMIRRWQHYAGIK